MLLKKIILTYCLLLLTNLFGQIIKSEIPKKASYYKSWADEKSIYSFYKMSPQNFFDSDAIAKEFKFFFTKTIDSSSEKLIEYDLSGKYTNMQTTGSNFLFYKNYFFTVIGNDLICFDLDKEDYFILYDKSQSTYGNYHYETNPTNNNEIIIRPDHNNYEVKVDLENRETEIFQLDFDKLSVVNILAHYYDNVFIKFQTESGSYGWAYYNISEDKAEIFQFPDKIKSFTNSFFACIPNSNVVYLNINNSDNNTVSIKYSYLFKINIETKSVEKILDDNSFSLEEFDIFGDKLLVFNSWNKKTHVISSNGVKEFKDCYRTSDYFFHKGNLYYYSFMSEHVGGKNQIIKVDTNTLDISVYKTLEKSIKMESTPKTYKNNGVYKSYFITYSKDKKTYAITEEPAIF